MKVLLLSDSKVGKRRFIESLKVCGNQSFHSMNNGIAISHLTARATVRRPSGDIEDWWHMGNEYPVYKKLMYTNVI